MTQASVDIEEKIYAEIDYCYFGGDWDLITIMNMDWKRLNPSTDPILYGLDYVSEESHILFLAESLVTDGFDLRVSRMVCLYTEENLMQAGEGPIAVPDKFDYLDDVEIDLTKDVPDEIVRVIVDFADCSRTDYIDRLLSSREEGEDEFISGIKNIEIKKLVADSWEKMKKFWEKYPQI